MASAIWCIEDDPDATDVACISDGVFHFGRAQAVGGDARPIACFLREGDRIVAGATGRTEFNRLFTSYLWVSDERRGQGLGSECLTRLEAAARARGCTDAVLETLSDSNQALYERLGYETIVTLVAWVGGFNRHFMRKSL
ncbi:MAG: GNAT family N-acetyltransferase [Pseudomonadales bacterium]|nr:GNAT family N-acetyltransferase [Pseudomonadales bacterium]MCP5182320.1 GNAT family N-acetyltransferase [Pseudomonadales bacterium]